MASINNVYSAHQQQQNFSSNNLPIYRNGNHFDGSQHATYSQSYNVYQPNNYQINIHFNASFNANGF
jgi:hypothetical protein